MTGYSGVRGDVTVPGTLGGTSVTGIGNSAFIFCDKLKSISLPEGITRIGENAFSNCSGLTSIELPKNVSSIGDNVFGGCKSLTSITVDVRNSYYSSMDGLLYDKEKSTLIVCPANISLTSLTLPEGVKTISGSAFRSCTGLTNISLPQSITSIGKLAFSNCTSLTNINLQEGLTSIGIDVFAYCKALTSVVIPDSVTTIEEKIFTNNEEIVTDGLNTNGMFEGCSNLKTAVLGKNLTIIPIKMFLTCENLETLTIKGNVTSIESSAFRESASLKSIALPDSLEKIGYSAFSSCGLTSINIPQSVGSIGEYAFWGCSALVSIQFNSGLTTLFDRDDTIPVATKIVGYDPSTAKDFAAKYNRTFEVIDNTTTLESIAITTPATKQSYKIGEVLDLTGLVVTGTYSDGAKKVVTVTKDNVTGFDSSTPVNDQILTITVNGKITNYSVNIVGQIILGDVDGSGKVQAFDALVALQIATGKKVGTAQEIKAADVGNSGSVEAFDALRILQYATGKITEF